MHPAHTTEPRSSYLESIPLTTSEGSSTQSGVNPFAERPKGTGLEQGRTVLSIPGSESESSSHLSGSSMALIEEPDAGKEGPCVQDIQPEVQVRHEPPLFSPAKVPQRDGAQRRWEDLDRKAEGGGRKCDLQQRDAPQEDSDWTVVGLLGMLGVVLLGVLLVRRAK